MSRIKKALLIAAVAALAIAAVLNYAADNMKLNIDPDITFNLPSNRVVEISGIITEATAYEIKNRVNNIDDGVRPIWVVIDSPGGEVTAGLVIYDRLKEARSKVITVCVNGCYSMAAVIFQVGWIRLMNRPAVLMYHESWTFVCGPVTLSMIKSAVPGWQEEESRLQNLVCNRVGISCREYKRMLLGQEIWYDAETAVNNGFADGIFTLGTY